MKSLSLRIVVSAALVFASGAALATFHTFKILEMYSDAAGAAQYIVLQESEGLQGQNQFTSHYIRTTSGGVNARQLTFATNLPSPQTIAKFVLIGTQSFAARGVVTPDYIVPDGFLPLANGSIDFASVDQVNYAALPTDGNNALFRDGSVKQNVATNFTGSTGSTGPSGPATPAIVTVVEYHHATFDHYFITPVPAEIALLDAHAPPFQDWSRTGFSFNTYVNATAPAGSVAICRFFNDHFAPKSSHFYAAHGFGCEATLSTFPDWGLEDDKLFNTMLPDTTGACPTGTIPVYRLYNNGMGAAPNHRFVTSLSERQAMIDKGYVAEGNGIGVGMCVPPSSGTGPVAATKGIWKGTTDQNESAVVIVLDNGTYYIVYNKPVSSTEAATVQGSSTSSGANFASSDGMNFPITKTAETSGFASPTAVSGTYVPQSTLQLTLGLGSGVRTLSASYVAGSDASPSLANVAGTYTGYTSHVSGARQGSFTFDASGHFTGHNDVCNFLGTIVPRSTVGVFDWTVSAPGNNCIFDGTLSGILYYDAASKHVYSFATFEARQDAWVMFGDK